MESEKQHPERAIVRRGKPQLLAPQTLGEAMEYAEMLAKSDLVPKDFRGKPENILITIDLGLSVGLTASQAIQSIAVINGRPSLWGDAGLAICQQHPDWIDHVEESFGEGDKRGCRVTIRRRGYAKPIVATFTIAQAKAAKLWGKAGPWTQYPDEMLRWRAVWRALRHSFADALKGLIGAEEAQDYPPLAPEDTDPRARVNVSFDEPKALPAPQEGSDDKGPDATEPEREPPDVEPKPITDKQRKRIFATFRKVHPSYSTTWLKGAIHHAYAVESTNDLSFDQASELIDDVAKDDFVQRVNALMDAGK